MEAGSGGKSRKEHQAGMHTAGRHEAKAYLGTEPRQSALPRGRFGEEAAGWKPKKCKQTRTGPT